MVQSRRKVKTVTSSTGVIVEKIYCRRCMTSKKPTDFFSAVDETLDRNGYFSVCKQCCNELYDGAYRAERNLAKAILKTCRTLNLKFDENAVSATVAQLETMNKDGTSEKVFGVYKSKLVQSSKNNFSDSNSIVDLTFHEVEGIALKAEDPLENHEPEKTTEELKHFWGDEFEYDDYVWLESEYSKWNKPNNQNEKTILKLVVLKLLAIRKKINASEDTSKLEKSLTELLTAGALSPVQANAASQGKMKDCFGDWIKDIESNEPAEWWKDHSIYKDVDNIAEYWKIHVLRPFLNFWGVQKDFDFEGAVETGSGDDDLSDSSSSEA